LKKKHQTVVTPKQIEKNNTAGQMRATVITNCSKQYYNKSNHHIFSFSFFFGAFVAYMLRIFIFFAFITFSFFLTVALVLCFGLGFCSFLSFTVNRQSGF